MDRVFFNYRHFHNPIRAAGGASRTVEITLQPAVSRAVATRTGGAVTMGDVLSDLRENGVDTRYDGRFLVHEVTHTIQQRPSRRRRTGTAPLDATAIAKGLRAAGYGACSIVTKNALTGAYTPLDGGGTAPAHNHVFQHNQSNLDFFVAEVGVQMTRRF